MYYDCMFADKHYYPPDPQDPGDEADGLKTLCDCMFADKHYYPADPQDPADKRYYPADPQDPADEADGLKRCIMIAFSRINTIILRIRRILRMRRRA